MANINVGEQGPIIQIDFGKDITTAVPKIMLQGKTGEAVIIESGITVPVIDSGSMVAGNYVEYIIKENDIDRAGRWRFRGEVKLSNGDITKTNYQFFTVNE